MKSGYIGSVRFYKNLILLFVIIAILVPTGFAISYRVSIKKLETQISTLNTTLQEQQALLAEKSEEEVTEDGYVSDNVEVDPPEYQELYPDFYAPKSFAATERQEGVIYLTFDDGPSRRTDEILDILAQKNVKATFFVIGQSREENLQRMRRIVEEGHAIGMHSFSHEYSIIYNSVEDYLADMYAIFCQIKETTGQTPVLFRFPGGSINGYNGGLYMEMVAEMIRRGFVPHDWNLSSEDAARSGVTVSNILNSVVGGAAGKSRGVVLMHDSEDKTATVNALSQMIDQLQAKGFRLEPLTPEIKPILFSYLDDK